MLKADTAPLAGGPPPSSSASSSSSSSSSSKGSASTGAKQTKRWQLKAEQELRLETGGDEKDDTGGAFTVKLLSGTAEVFGAEMAKNVMYSFTEAKIAVFTWKGCVLEVSGSPAVQYTAEDTPMIAYVNTHAALEKLRRAKVAEPQGPRVVIAGPVDSGKSTLCKLLLNYAVRSGWKPTFVDLDVGQGDITIPGALAATPVEHPYGLDSHASLTVKAPLVHFYGHNSPGKAEDMFRRTVQSLAAAVFKRLAENKDARESGIIINTCGWVDGKGYDLLVHSARTFQADVVLVVGMERLFSQLKSDKQMEDVAVVRVPKSGGVVTRPTTNRRSTRQRRIKHYFYGEQGKLCPHTKVVNWRDITVYQVGGGPQAPSHTLPIGKKALIDPNMPTQVEPSAQLVNMVLAVSYAKTAMELLTKNVAGFVQVTAVNTQRRTLSLLVPTPGPLPGNFLLMGTIKWFD